jgi:hypothetical protein
MVSNLKSETARANDAKSRGPTTDDAKEKSSRNGLTADHGNILLDCENNDQFDDVLTTPPRNIQIRWVKTELRSEPTAAATKAVTAETHPPTFPSEPNPRKSVIEHPKSNIQPPPPAATNPPSLD